MYRGNSPAQLFRIASNQEIATSFTDTGLEKELVAPPDPNFDHANFYWRMELQPESPATLHGTASIGSDGLEMTENRYRGMIARITRGKGAGQERQIAGNTATELTVSPAWAVIPDASSQFVVAESGWRFGALAKSSPVQFELASRGGETVEICGRAANVNDLECAAELSTVTRWQLGGSGVSDLDVPPMPYFGLGAGQRGGTVELSGVSFTDLTNTSTISAATLTLHYWDELTGIPSLRLQQGVADDDSVLDLNGSGNGVAGDLLQIDGEILRVDERPEWRHTVLVTRGVHSSAGDGTRGDFGGVCASQEDGDRVVSGRTSSAALIAGVGARR